MLDPQLRGPIFERVKSKMPRSAPNAVGLASPVDGHVEKQGGYENAKKAAERFFRLG